MARLTPGWQGLLGNAPNSLSTHNKMLCQWKFPHEHPTPCISSAQTSCAAPHPHDLSTPACPKAELDSSGESGSFNEFQLLSTNITENMNTHHVCVSDSSVSL